MKPYWKGPIQTVVFQGTKDYTVFPVNGEQTTLQWVIANDLGISPGGSPLSPFPPFLSFSSHRSDVYFMRPHFFSLHSLMFADIFRSYQYYSIKC